MRTYFQNGTATDMNHILSDTEEFSIQCETIHNQDIIYYSNDTLVREIDVELVDIYDKFRDLYFQDVNLYYNEISMMPSALYMGGLSSEVPIDKNEFLDLIEFCFDDEYYPEILGKMKPYERFYIYRSLNDIPCIFDRTETFKTTTFYTHNDNIPVWLTDKGYLKRNSKKIKTTLAITELAALDEYKKKNANNEAKKVYDKYYKRYHARIATRQIKEPEFNQWRYKAITMRDDCNDGKITLQEYIDWNEVYFPNRAKKK